MTEKAPHEEGPECEMTGPVGDDLGFGGESVRTKPRIEREPKNESRDDETANEHSFLIFHFFTGLLSPSLRMIFLKFPLSIYFLGTLYLHSCAALPCVVNQAV